MTSALARNRTSCCLLRRAWVAVLAALCLLQASAAHALPIFARQTGKVAWRVTPAANFLN
jgi:hypothetical protein